MLVKSPDPVSVPSDGMRGIVESESTKWVESMVSLLEDEGRPIEGGWPGTVSEARSRLLTRLAEQKKESPRDSDELAVLVDLLYSQSRQLWLHQR